MTIQKLGITPETLPYELLRSKYRQGLGWLTKCVGSPSDIHDGQIDFYNLKPDVATEGSRLHKLIITNPVDSQTPMEQAHEYFLGVCSLVHPWQKMFISPPFNRFNRQVSRFAASYDSPDFFPMTKLEKLIKFMVDAIKLQLQQKEKEVKVNRKSDLELQGNNDDFFKDLGSEINMSQEAVRQRDEEIIANNERRQLRAVKPFKDELAIMAVIQNADPAYVLAILFSNEVGIKHKNDSVRMGALNIVKSLAHAVVPSLNKELLSEPFIMGMSQKIIQVELIDEAISILSSISRMVNSKGYGMNDTNYSIRSASEEVDKYVIEAAIELTKLKLSL